MKKSLWLLLFVLISCSSAPEKENVQDEFSALDNTDFASAIDVKYRPSEDKFDRSIAAIDVLAGESVSRIDNDELKSISKDTNLLNAAIASCYIGDMSRAQRFFDEGFAKFRTHPTYWNLIGNCYLSKSDRLKAILFYNKALDIDSNYSPALNNIGVIAQREGNDQKALTAYEQALKYNPKAKTPKFNMAEIYLKYGLISKAEPIYVELYRMNKEDEDIINALGVIQLSKGHYEKAVEFFSAISKRKLVSAKYALNYAIALRANGDKDEAIKVVNNINEKDKKSYQSYYNKVVEYVKNR